MTKRRRVYMISCLFFSALMFFTQCELFLGESENVNVSIDLGALFDGASGRAIAPYKLSSIKISVFGSGMLPVEKTISPSTRYVNISVPAGPDRHFTLEMFLATPEPDQPHVLSYKGRATATLRPGVLVKLLFNMVAGSTALIGPDLGNNQVFQSDDMSFSDITTDILNFDSLLPTDLDVASDGWIYAVSFSGMEDPVGTAYANDLAGTTGSGTFGAPTGTYTYSNAIDRDSRQDLNFDGQSDDLYYLAGLMDSANFLRFTVLDPSHTPLGFVPLVTSDPDLGTILAITGMAVDPWTHHLFIVGMMDTEEAAIIEYDPFYIDPAPKGGARGQILRVVTNQRFRTLSDVIVKDDGIFVLNQIDIAEPAETAPPVVLKFDRNLNYITGFGYLSYDPSKSFIASSSSGAFYHPKRFIAHENEKLFIIDDSNLLDPKAQDFDKIVSLDTDLGSGSWETFPAVQPAADGSTTEYFYFFETPPM